MLYLNERDILNAVSADEILDTIENAMLLYERKDFLMPDRQSAPATVSAYVPV